MNYEEETLVRSPLFMSIDDEGADKEIGEGGPLGDDIIDELGGDDIPEEDVPLWEEEDSLDDEEEEDAGEEF